MAKGGSKALTGILCFIFGFLFAIIVEVAVIAAGVYFLLNADIDKLLSTVGVENTDEEGKNIYINTNVEEGGVQKVTDLVSRLKEFADKGADNLTLGDFTDLFPIGDTGIDRVYSALADALSSSGMTEEELRDIIDEEELKATPFSKLGEFFADCGKAVPVDAVLSIAGIDVQSSALYLSIAYGSEAAVAAGADGYTVLYKDTFVLEEGSYVRADGAVLPASLVSYLEESAGGDEYYLYYSVHDGARAASATVARSTEDGYVLTDIAYGMYDASSAVLSGGYYYNAADELVVVSDRTLGEVMEGDNGIMSVFDDVYVTDILDKEGDDELVGSILGGVTVGDLLNGDVSFDDKIDSVAIPMVIDVSPEDAIMMYVGYSITGIEEAQGDDYNYTGTINFYEMDGEEWAVSSTEQAFIYVEGGIVGSVYYVKDGAKISYDGVTMADIGAQTSNITNALKVKDVIEIEEGDSLMEKLGEYYIADIGDAIDELYLSDFVDGVTVDDGLMAYMVYGISNISEASGAPAGVTHTADYALLGEDGAKTVIEGVYVIADGQGVITRAYYIEEGVEVECFTSVNDVNARVDGMMDDITLGELMDIDEEDGEVLNALKDSSINSLSEDLNSLTLQELFTESVYGENAELYKIAEDKFDADYIYYEYNSQSGEYVLVNGDGKADAWQEGYYTYGKAESVWSLLLYTDGGEQAYGLNDITALQGNVVGNLQKQTMFDFYDMGVIGDGTKKDDTWNTLEKIVTYGGKQMKVGEMTLSQFIGYTGGLIQ